MYTYCIFVITFIKYLTVAIYISTSLAAYSSEACERCNAQAPLMSKLCNKCNQDTLKEAINNLRIEYNISEGEPKYKLIFNQLVSIFHILNSDVISGGASGHTPSNTASLSPQEEILTIDNAILLATIYLFRVSHFSTITIPNIDKHIRSAIPLAQVSLLLFRQRFASNVTSHQLMAMYFLYWLAKKTSNTGCDRPETSQERESFLSNLEKRIGGIDTDFIDNVNRIESEQEHLIFSITEDDLAERIRRLPTVGLQCLRFQIAGRRTETIWLYHLSAESDDASESYILISSYDLWVLRLPDASTLISAIAAMIGLELHGSEEPSSYSDSESLSENPVAHELPSNRLECQEQYDDERVGGVEQCAGWLGTATKCIYFLIFAYVLIFLNINDTTLPN